MENQTVTLEIINELTLPFSDDDAALLLKAANLVFTTCAQTNPDIESMNAEISLILTNDAEIRKINAEYRQIDKATDVLSFPMIDFSEIAQMDDWKLETNPETGNLLLGDIIISLERAKEQALEYGHSYRRELAFLIIHGMLHLLGFDHEETSEEQIMFLLQDEILGKLGMDIT